MFKGVRFMGFYGFCLIICVNLMKFIKRSFGFVGRDFCRSFLEVEVMFSFGKNGN